jgi:hypothetical protein
VSDITRIAAILLRNLSDALLTTALEISKLDAFENTPKTFTQADDNPTLLESEKPKLITRYQYEAKEKVLVLFEGASSPTRYRILKRIDSNNYIVYPQNASKSMAREVTVDQILGLDPNR